MRRISFDPRFVNAAGTDLISGKIHTIRQNFDYWKRFEGKEAALFTWEGKPRQKGSKQKVFCVKRIVSVQEIHLKTYLVPVNQMKYPEREGVVRNTEVLGFFIGEHRIPNKLLAERDGFSSGNDFLRWFYAGNYKPGKMAIIHFTDFRY